MPCQWDFPHVTKDWCLPEVQVGAWGGFVFVNPDPQAGPLQDFLGPLSDHFRRWPLEDRYKQAHVAKVLGCNWKVAQGAFMEAYHVVATHPQLLAGIGDANSAVRRVRQLQPRHHAERHAQPAPQVDADGPGHARRHVSTGTSTTRRWRWPSPGQNARQVAGELRRDVLRPVLGDAGADLLSDAELCDSMYYTVFPNFHPWGTYNRIVYRFRPNGDRHDQSIMECMFLSPFVGERPPSAPIHWLGLDDDFVEDAPELGLLARVFNQDVYNLPKVQAGLETGAIETVTLALYQETKLRHFHRLLDAWVSAPERAPKVRA